MATGQTLAIAAPPLPEWSDREPCHPQQRQMNGGPDLCLEDHDNCYLRHCFFRIGIYGWRKRCLYLLVILLFSLVVINLSLTVWIIKVLDFTMDGMGNLRIRKDGLRLDGRSTFLKSLYAAEIRSRQDRSLKFESSRNITIHTRNAQGKITNRLHMGAGRLEGVAEQFTIRKRRGEILLHVDDKEVIMAADRMRVTGEGGVVFKGSIQTPIVKSEPSEQLRLESPTRQMKISAPEGVGVESRAGDISATCMKDLKLISREGTIWLNSEGVVFRNLRTVLPTSRGRSYHGIYEMCSCKNGRLFLSAPEGQCKADNIVCQ